MKEVAAQIDIPLISDKPFFQELAVGAAGRISDYSVTGSVTSYEADARWRPIDNLLFRGSYQRAVRAPNIAELFSPPQNAQLAIGTPPAALGDPCDTRSSAHAPVPTLRRSQHCALRRACPQASSELISSRPRQPGRPSRASTAITPEKANTYNVGFVFNAPRNDGILGDFSISVDYYNISIRNVISSIPGGTVLSGCYNLNGSNPTYSLTNSNCALITRDTSTGQLLNVNLPYQNLGSLKTDGIEAQIHWGVPARSLVKAASSMSIPRSTTLKITRSNCCPGSAFLDYTGVSVGTAFDPSSVPPRATPKWKGLTTFGYRSDDLNFGLRWKYQNALDDVSQDYCAEQYRRRRARLFDLGYVRLRQRSVNSSNCAAVSPTCSTRGLPFVASNQTGTDTAQYDLIGRSFYMGFKVVVLKIWMIELASSFAPQREEASPSGRTVSSIIASWNWT